MPQISDIIGHQFTKTRRYIYRQVIRLGSLLKFLDWGYIMKNYFSILFVSLFLLFPLTIRADDIHEWQDAKGNWHVTELPPDQPVKKYEKHSIEKNSGRNSQENPSGPTSSHRYPSGPIYMKGSAQNSETPYTPPPTKTKMDIEKCQESCEMTQHICESRCDSGHGWTKEQCYKTCSDAQDRCANRCYR